MRLVLYIALAGALGSVCRYLVGLAAVRALPASLPLGTLIVNVVGAFAIGLAMEILGARGARGGQFQVALTVGFLGGFTTYSSFALESVTLLDGGRAGHAAAYVGLTLVLAAGACWAGVVLARALR